MKINTEFMQKQATTQRVYHETEVEWLKLLDRKLNFLYNAEIQRQLVSMNEREGAQVLHVGPDAGIPTTTTVFNKGSAVSHLQSIAHDIMTTGIETRSKNLQADPHLRKSLQEWFGGQNSLRLWLYGNQVTMVSATVYAAAMDRRRPCIAFTGRHHSSGQQLNNQEILFRMVYSLLFQLLLQFDDDSTIFVTDVGGSFEDLDLSMNSMPVALRYFKYFLILVPQCICIIDGWQFIGNSAEGEVTKFLKDFLDLFQRPPGPVGVGGWDDSNLLLLTSSGNSQILRDLGQNYVRGFSVTGHFASNGPRLYTSLLGMEW
ncbi:hypothetical protein AK830_g8976 [Neonectria ditissima]|uniref:Uncharacterized protein n=1 Tax=Neonectria ditissima TaxID=78410 RepID=A0A0P7AJD8_9HYPO|nr:hypothetical protein AK830_g8976 [Neonectria ditissima]